jgi:hypothetical protein
MELREKTTLWSTRSAANRAGSGIFADLRCDYVFICQRLFASPTLLYVRILPTLVETT